MQRSQRTPVLFVQGSGCWEAQSRRGHCEVFETPSHVCAARVGFGAVTPRHSYSRSDLSRPLVGAEPSAARMSVVADFRPPASPAACGDKVRQDAESSCAHRGPHAQAHILAKTLSGLLQVVRRCA